MTVTIQTFEVDRLDGRREVLVDCSTLPLRRVASEAPWAALRWPPLILCHPDLWHDGRWKEVMP
jgi:hypothetical protein